MAQFANEIKISGIVAKDAVINSFDKAVVARFPLAIRRKDHDSYSSALMPIEAWRNKQNAHFLNIIKKGERITVHGYFRAEEWTDDKNVHHSRIVIESMAIYKTDEFKPKDEQNAQQEQPVVEKKQRSRAKKAA